MSYPQASRQLHFHESARVLLRGGRIASHMSDSNAARCAVMPTTGSTFHQAKVSMQYTCGPIQVLQICINMEREYICTWSHLLPSNCLCFPPATGTFCSSPSYFMVFYGGSARTHHDILSSKSKFQVLPSFKQQSRVLYSVKALNPRPLTVDRRLDVQLSKLRSSDGYFPSLSPLWQASHASSSFSSNGKSRSSHRSGYKCQRINDLYVRGCWHTQHLRFFEVPLYWWIRKWAFLSKSEEKRRLSFEFSKFTI